LGTSDKDGFRAWSLVSPTPTGWGYADELGRWLLWSTIGRSSGELILDDSFYVVDTYEHVLGLEIYDRRRGAELSLGRNEGVEVGVCAPV
jgi:hypothetical protein